MIKSEGYAKVVWHPGDITCRTNLTEAEAAEWLERNEKHIADRLVEVGNEDVIPTLLAMDGIEVVEE